MKKALHILLILLVAVLSVALSEVVMTVVWLPNAPVAVTSNFFLMGLIPVQLVVVGIASLLLVRIFRQKPQVYIPVYVVLFCGIHGAELNQFFNPMQDILRYWLAIVIAAGIWTAIWWRHYTNHQIRTSNN